MMKLIIQIPCFNEAETLPVCLASLPRQVEGFDRVEWLVIDDGSLDKTIQVAGEHGADHIVSHAKNMGLAKAFNTGIHACLDRGADVIVNTDADNQYRADCIPDLVRPILERKAEMVIGARTINEIRHFSWIKKVLQRLGTWSVRLASNTNVPDATSGFRAFSRAAAQRLNVFNNYTYTLETIIQAGQKGIPIVSIPVGVNPPLRPSRLIRSTLTYVWKSIVTIVRIFVVYRPFRFFFAIGTTLFSVGLVIGLRFLYFYSTGRGTGHVQSLILASVLLGIGFQTILVAFLADLLSVNRRLLEEIQWRLRNLPKGTSKDPDA